MTNQKFTARLKIAKKNLDLLSKKSNAYLLDDCSASKIFWYAVLCKATFLDEKLFEFDYLKKKFPESQRRAAAIALIDDSIKMLQESEK